MIRLLVPVCMFLVYGCTVPHAENSYATEQIEVIARKHQWLVRYAGPDGKLGQTDVKQYSRTNPAAIDTADVAGKDDVLATDTLFLLRSKNVQLCFRSLDVIHSAYIPQLRLQMNCVPGMRSTVDLSERLHSDALQEKPCYDFLLLCNKICGSGHYQMNMRVRVK